MNNPVYREKLTREQVEQIVREETAEVQTKEFKDTVDDAKKSNVELFVKEGADKEKNRQIQEQDNQENQQ